MIVRNSSFLQMVMELWGLGRGRIGIMKDNGKKKTSGTRKAESLTEINNHNDALFV